MIRLIAVIALCVSAIFMYLALGNSSASPAGVTVQDLKTRWDTITNNAEQRLERDFNGEYTAVIAMY